jgi:sulfotransferase
MKVHFMAGMPRSGTTLLASILNQNPAVYCSPNSPLYEHLRDIDTANYESYRMGVMQDCKRSLLNGAIDSFYKHKDADVVIDRSRVWGVPYYMRLLRYALGMNSPKILCPVRPLAEVVASFIVKAQANPNNFIDRSMMEQDFLPLWRKPINDARVDWLLSPNSMLDTAILSVHTALRSEDKHLFHVFSYDDLVSKPGGTINDIYDFLGLDSFSHDYTRIANTEPYDDMNAFGIPDLHLVDHKIRPSQVKPESVLSEYALERCALEDFWTRKLDDR